MSGEVDVAVVGAGVAGLYTAFSLLERSTPVPGGAGPPRVALIEASDRIGGRLHTETPPTAPHLRAEVGGMRYYSSQVLLAGVLERLGLRGIPFHRGAMSDEHDLFYLRGSRFTLADLEAAADVVPFQLAPTERGEPVSHLVRRAIERLIPDYLSLTQDARRALERTLLVEEQPIYARSVGELLASGMSAEALALVRDGGGYREQLDPAVSAALMLQVGDSIGQQQTIEGGMQGLTDALGATVGDAVDRRLGTRLCAIEEVGDGRLRLRLERMGQPDELVARHVVLALARRGLELLDRGAGPLAAPAVGETLAGLGAVQAVKIYLAFAEPWWERLGIASGKSVTDLPMHQCIYFGVEQEAPGGIAGDRDALMVATYADSADVAHWRALAADPTPFAGPNAPPEGLGASDALVAEALRELSEVHGADIPSPTWAIYKDWGVDPHGGGWHSWRTGTLSLDAIPRIRRPSPEHPLYVCGEAFSARQGWVQGALQTAERVLQDHLAQPAPAWLDPSADLGP